MMSKIFILDRISFMSGLESIQEDRPNRKEDLFAEDKLG